MAPQLKLSYFNIAGRGELTRLTFACGKVDFQDDRVQGPDFMALKPTLPLGQLPVLTVDGQVYAQSIALARYAAKLGGLYPEDALQALRVDMIVDTLLESQSPLLTIEFGENDEAKKAEKVQTFVEVTAPRIYGALEKLVSGEFFLDSITLADVSLFDQIENSIKPNIPNFKLEAYPKLSKVYNNVKSHPNIAAYLAKQHTN